MHRRESGKRSPNDSGADGYDLIVVGRRLDRLEELARSLTNVVVRVMAVDLSTDDGVDLVAEVCATQSVTMLVNNAGVAHYMPLADLSADMARELVHVKWLPQPCSCEQWFRVWWRGAKVRSSMWRA